MRIWILSDLHLEFHDFEPDAPDVDAVVLAGDTHVGDKGVLWAMERLPDLPVVYVMGNHEYYGQNAPELLGELRALTRGTHVRLLENDTVVIDGVRFLGCTLWSDFTLYGDPKTHMAYARLHMSDFYLIRVPGGLEERRFDPRDAQAMHHTSADWLRRELEAPSALPTVVVTHNAPTRSSIKKLYAGHPLTPAFVTDHEALVAASGARCWIHGHVHDTFDYRIGSTRVVCNPRGYPNEEKNGFDPYLIIDV